MSKFTGMLGDVAAPEERQAPVPKEGLGPLISDVGNLVLTGLKVGTTLDLQSKAKDLEREFIAETDTMLSAGEAMEVRDFSERIKRLQQVGMAEGRISEFKTRAEALLKQKINMFPGLADHYRAALSSTLGFDPTGATAEARARAVLEEARSAQELIESYDKDAQERFGFMPGEILQPEAQASYIAQVQHDKKVKQLERLAQEKRLTKELGGAAFVTATVEQLQDVISGYDHGINNTITAVFREAGIDFPSVEAMTPELYQTVGTERIEALTRQLQVQKAEKMAEIAALASELDESRVGEMKQLVAAKFDSAIQQISAQSSLERWKQDIAIQTQKDLNQISNTEAYRKAAAWGSFTDTPLPAEMQTALMRGSFVLLDAINPDTEEISPEQTAGASSSELKGIVTYFKKIAEDIKNSDAAPATKEQVLDGFAKIADAYSRDMEGGLTKEAADTWIGILANPDNNELVTETLKQSPFIGQAVSAGIHRYMANNLNRYKTKLREELRSASFVQTTPVWEGKKIAEVKKEITEYFIPKLLPTGIVDLQINESAIKEVAPDMLKATGRRGAKKRSPVERTLTRLRGTLLKDINLTVAAMANTSNVSKQEAAERLLGEFFETNVDKELGHEGDASNE